MRLEALLTLNYGVYVVSSFKDGRFNGQISNTAMQITNDPKLTIAVAINKQNLTHQYISDSGYFSIAVLSEDAPLEFIGRFGFKSGRDFDKYGDISFETAPNGCPYPSDYVLSYLEIKVIKTEDMGSHTLFTGEVLDADVIGEGVPMHYSYYRHHLRGKTPPTAPTFQQSSGAETIRMPSGAGMTAVEDKSADRSAEQYESYVCGVCGHIYNPADGDPANDIDPGTPFEDLPDDWCCPVCGSCKSDFSPA